MGANSEIKSAVILFDGVCNLCNASVNFIIDRDPRHRFKFTSLQSEIGQELLAQFPELTTGLDSVILIKNGKAYNKSSAALNICRSLSGLWPLFYVFVVIPPFIRDYVYQHIAKHRYRWFGKTDSCRMPSAEQKHRFL